MRLEVLFGGVCGRHESFGFASAFEECFASGEHFGVVVAIVEHFQAFQLLALHVFFIIDNVFQSFDDFLFVGRKRGGGIGTFSRFFSFFGAFRFESGGSVFSRCCFFSSFGCGGFAFHFFSRCCLFFGHFFSGSFFYFRFGCAGFGCFSSDGIFQLFFCFCGGRRSFGGRGCCVCRSGEVLDFVHNRFLDEGLCHFLSRRVFGGTINYGIRSAQKKVYVLVSFFARPFVSLVSHIVRYAPSFSDKGAFLRKLHST